MSSTAVEASRFIQWLNVVLPEMGASVQAVTQSVGLEFESGSMTVSVTEHPHDGERVIIEVWMRSIAMEELTGAGAELMVLHQLNDRARREHDWVISIDDELGLTIGTTARCSELDAPGLQRLMADGFEKAEAVEALWQDLTGSAAPESAADNASALMLRI